MIVKFDHITYVASRNEKDNILPRGKKPVFVEEGLINLGCKKRIMAIQQDEHDLYFYNGTYPIEYIFYDKVSSPSCIVLENDIVYGEYYDKVSAVVFLKRIFGNKVVEENNVIVCNMKGVLDKRDYLLELRKGEKKETYVDNSGYGVVALVVNRPLEAGSEGGEFTAEEKLVVNNQELNISFVKTDYCNVIFEMIRINK